MPLYAPDTAMRVRQLAADAGLLLWIVGWVLVARAVHGAVLSLAEPGQAVEDLGDSVARNMDSAAGVAEDVPLVGDELAGPFEQLARAGDSVRGAGQGAQDAVDTLAWVLAVALIVLPVAFILARWLPWRVRWLRESTAAGQLAGDAADLELLAARAMATAPLTRLAALPTGIGAAWRAGDPAAVRTLAAVELGRLGLRLPGESGSTAAPSRPGVPPAGGARDSSGRVDRP